MPYVHTIENAKHTKRGFTLTDEPPPREGVALLAGARPDLDAGAAAGLGVMTDDAVPPPPLDAITCAPPDITSPLAAAAPLRDLSPRAPRADGVPPLPGPTVLREAGCLAGDSDTERLDMARGGGPGDRSGFNGERGSSSMLCPRLLPRQSEPRLGPPPALTTRDLLPLLGLPSLVLLPLVLPPLLLPLLVLVLLLMLLVLPVLLLLLFKPPPPPPPPLAPTEDEQLEEERIRVPRSIVKEPLQCASLSETEKLLLCRFAGAE